MTAVVTSAASIETLADLLEQLGGISPNRVRFRPAPGMATEEDILAIRNSPERRLCELVDGALVEKAPANARIISRLACSWCGK